jgi:hypothetical protein
VKEGLTVFAEIYSRENGWNAYVDGENIHQFRFKSYDGAT